MPGERDDGFGTKHEISGGDFEGPVIMVRDISGPVHFDSPRPEDQSAGAGAASLRTAGVIVLLGVLVFVVMALLQGDEEMLSPGARRILALTGAVLVVAGSLWWATVQLGLSAWLRERRAPRRKPTPAQLNSAAGALAAVLADEYSRDEKQLHVHDPAPIPIRWSAARPELTDHAANIRRTPIKAGAPDDRPLDLDGDFDAIGPFFAGIPSRRLVVLGAPGAGKSALVLHLARCLLDTLEPGAPVPVLLPIASWNCTEEDLWHWAARRLAAQHPAVLRSPQLAHDLLTSGRILPILDGLDELPEPSRPRALARLRRSLNEPARLVLTCRIEEYEAAVEEADIVLPAAAVVQLEPLTVVDLEHYLPRTARPKGPTSTKWAPVLARLSDSGDQAPEVVTLRTVLSTPLMVSLARVVYTGTRADPRELIEDERFREQTVVERHLYDAFLSAAYEDTEKAGWTGRQARSWAGHLAGYLRANGEQDIAWWRLGEVMPWWVRWLGTGLSMVVAALAIGVTDYDSPWWQEWCLVPPWAAVLILGSVAAMVDWSIDAPADAPQRLYWPGIADLRNLRPEVRLLLFIVLFGALVVGVLATLGLSWWVITTAAYCGVALGLGVLTRLTDVLARLADPADAPEPAELLRADRRTQLVLGLLAPLRLPPRLWLSEGLLILLSSLVVMWHRTANRGPVSTLDWVVSMGLFFLAWMVCRWSVSASGRLSVARLYLSCTGALPWRVMTFLRDAHRRGVLRQSGGLYRFRHIELRNRLAEGEGAVEDGVSSPVRTRHRSGPLSLEVLLGPAPAVVLFAFVLAAAVLSLDLRLPYRGIPHPCALVSQAQVNELIVEPVRSEPFEGACAFDESSPFRPDRRLVISPYAWMSEWGSGGSAVDEARRGMREDRVDGDEPLPGLGDEAMIEASHTGPHGEPMATVNVRAGNITLWLEYSEEYATLDRVSEVAAIIARTTLLRAGVPEELVGPDRRHLAEVPPAQVAHRLRTAAYKRVPERSVLGPVWRGEEHSDIQTFDRLSVPVRIPSGLRCVEGKQPLENGETTARCGITDDEPPLLDMGDLPCGADGCTSSLSDAFRERWSGGGVGTWKRTEEGNGRYLERYPKDGQYELILFVTSHDGRHALWFRALVPRADAEVAQKMVNAAYTQAVSP
ncbi:NACHT domain-containing protein [Streptomyces sp. NPDC003635]